ncbi:unnamed protein product [Anisakis simplex]|uniref:Kunitz/Bovine pancreatic trypsin inhibitor domain protein n=1 Tax=Anisakis simplex TaxID=6269 RepID=A0A0M3JUR6_ANISI|nr:unnamed protein product [Anisakis simplex]
MHTCIGTIIVTFLIVLAETGVRGKVQSVVRECAGEKNKGHVCGATDKAKSKAKVQWYYDQETEMCLAFKYNGCGGNTNRFNTIKQCERHCIPEDYGWCALSKDAFKNSDGESRVCYGHNMQPQEKCPADYRCKMLAFFGVCCPKRTEELFERNYRARCENGTTVKMDRGGYETPVFGRSCADDFCPMDTRCVDQEVLAYCCRDSTSLACWQIALTLFDFGRIFGKESSTMASMQHFSLAALLLAASICLGSDKIIFLNVWNCFKRIGFLFWSFQMLGIFCYGNKFQLEFLSDADRTECQLPLDKGTPCTQEGGVKPSVAWWHDDKSGICLSFKYTGCGGNANRFTTIKNCEQHCKMPDRGACALGKKPAEDSNGEQLVCAGMREDKCPNGYQCKMMAFMGLCCPTKEEGKPVKMDRGSGWMMTILGKSCDDQFCPEDAKCEQGKLFANCCK